MKPINTSYYDFATLITGGYVYVGVNYDPAARTVDAVRTEVAMIKGSGL